MQECFEQNFLKEEIMPVLSMVICYDMLEKGKKIFKLWWWDNATNVLQLIRTNIIPNSFKPDLRYLERKMGMEAM